MPGLMSLKLSVKIYIQMGLEFDWNNMKAWIIPALFQLFMLVLECDDAGDIFLAHIGPVTNWALVILLLIVSIFLWPSCNPLLMAAASSMTCHVTKLKLSQTGYLNSTMCSLNSNGFHIHQISIQQSSSGMWWNCDAIMSIWAKILEECFQHLVESVPQRTKTVWKASTKKVNL